MRDVGLASVAISVLTIFPPLLVMATVNKVLQYHSISTLILLSLMMGSIFIYETLLGYARRLIMSVVATRIDAKLSLSVFDRLLRLPLDYFERNPAGETMYRVNLNLPHPRVPYREIALDLSRPHHALYSFARSVLLTANFGFDRSYLRFSDSCNYLCLFASA